MNFDKKNLSEEDIKMKYITPAIEKAGWDIKKQVREEYTFTDGRVIVRGNLRSRGKKSVVHPNYWTKNLTIGVHYKNSRLFFYSYNFCIFTTSSYIGVVFAFVHFRRMPLGNHGA